MPSRFIKFAGVVAVGATLGFGASACGKSGDNAPNGVTIAFVGAQTGENAQLGMNFSNGAKLAIDQYNATNPKVKVHFKAYDTRGDPSVAPGEAQKAVRDKVTAIIGPEFSGESKAVDADFEKAKIPNVSVATATALGKNGWKYWHRILSNDDVQGRVDGEFIAGTLGAKKAFVIDDDQEYSVGLADKVFATLQGAGVTVTRDKIDPQSTDYSSTVKKVKSSGATAIFYGGYYAEAGKLLKQLRAGGFTGTFVSDDAANDPELISTAGAKQAEGALASCACQSVNSTSGNPAVKKFIDDYKAKYHTEQRTYSAEGFDAANLFLSAIKAGKTTGPEINDFLKTVRVTGVSKPIKFAATGEIENNAIYMFGVENGKLTFLGDATKVKLLHRAQGQSRPVETPIREAIP
ncbi:branched-chain amino acid ABC transporter substrate-binding protein [Actinoallomurus acanthiterrae]